MFEHYLQRPIPAPFPRASQQTYFPRSKDIEDFSEETLTRWKFVLKISHRTVWWSFAVTSDFVFFGLSTSLFWSKVFRPDELFISPCFQLLIGKLSILYKPESKGLKACPIFQESMSPKNSNEMFRPKYFCDRRSTQIYKVFVDDNENKFPCGSVSLFFSGRFKVQPVKASRDSRDRIYDLPTAT